MTKKPMKPERKLPKIYIHQVLDKHTKDKLAKLKQELLKRG
jgi:hypothetical protein